MIPVDPIEALTTSLARWDGRGPTPDDDFDAGRDMAAAIMNLLAWNANQP